MPANQAGKGPQPRSYDTAASNAGYDRVFGKKKPWWEVRDERAAMEEEDDLDRREQAAGAEDVAKRLAKAFMRRGQYEGVEGGLAPDPEPPAPEPFNPYQVPLVDSPVFGVRLSNPVRDSLVIVLRRGQSGWHTPPNLQHSRLPGQIYKADIDEAVADTIREIVVVGLNTGTWVTVWASSPSEITHPAKPQ